jgi:hypothetical protein
LGKAPSKNKDHKSKSDVKSPATVQVASNNVRKCYICNDPNHLANACPQKGKHKQNAKAKLQKNKSFLTLFKSCFPTLDQQACATRMINAWGEDTCSSCILPSFFAHECDPNDSNVITHVPHVRQTIASTPLLQYIQEAHQPQHNSLQASNTVSMNTSFFLQAEGHSADSTGDQSPIHRYASSDDESDGQSNSESRSLREGNSQSSDDDRNSDKDHDSDNDRSSDDDHNSQLDVNSFYSNSDESSIE